MDPWLRGSSVSAPQVDFTFPHHWQAQTLSERPAILPARHFTYPNNAEEVERGALEVLVRPQSLGPVAEEPVLSLSKDLDFETRERVSARPVSKAAQPFLATCALGFSDPLVPTGIWSTPDLEEICVISGGYAYLIDTTAPDRFTMLPYRPVLQVRPVPENNLLLFIGHHAILAWGEHGEAWQSPKLSHEGVTITTVDGGIIRGLGWNLITDKEAPFALDLRTGALSQSR